MTDSKEDPLTFEGLSLVKMHGNWTGIADLSQEKQNETLNDKHKAWNETEIFGKLVEKWYVCNLGLEMT